MATASDNGPFIVQILHVSPRPAANVIVFAVASVADMQSDFRVAIAYRSKQLRVYRMVDLHDRTRTDPDALSVNSVFCQLLAFTRVETLWLEHIA